MLVLDWTVIICTTACQLSNFSLCLFHLCSHLTLLCVGAPKECFDRGRSASTPCLGGEGDLCGGSSHIPCGWGASGPSLLCWKTCGQNRGRRCWACSREWGTPPWVCGCFPAPQTSRWNRRTRRFRRRSWGRRAARDPWWGPEGGQRAATPLRQSSQRENRPSRKKESRKRLTSAMSSSMVLMHSTTRSIFPPTSTTRSVDWGQHSWNSLMLVFVFWGNEWMDGWMTIFWLQQSRNRKEGFNIKDHNM